MNFTTLNTSDYEFTGLFYNSEFEEILTKVVSCYQQMLLDNVALRNDENSIRDCMLNQYLKKQGFKKHFNVTNYLFDSELPESTGRIDIRIMPVNPFICDDAYYVIECKRLDATNLDGTSGLNGKYITEGIHRFVSEKYSSYYGTNGMIGFIVQEIDIHSNVTSINNLLQNSFKNSNTTRGLINRTILSDYNYCYRSSHTTFEKEISIYHLMLDFSKNIENLNQEALEI